METLGVIVTLLALAVLWGAAVAFGRDSRDGHDWWSRTNAGDRPHRLGD